MTATTATGEETHLSCRSGWLRAAVLGVNDGIDEDRRARPLQAAAAASAIAFSAATIAG
jgi:hypothetical protein